MDSLYHDTNRLIQETQEYFQQLTNPQIETSSVENSIQTKIAQVNA